MATKHKTTKVQPKPIEIVEVKKTKKPVETISWAAVGAYMLFGLLFGYFLSKARATDYDTIVDMFMAKEFQLYGVIGVAILLVAAGLFIFHRFKIHTLSGKDWEWEPVEFEPSRLIGALIFGAGWALAGSCPGTVITQLGEGKVYAIFTILGIFAGVWGFQIWKPNTSNDSSC